MAVAYVVVKVDGVSDHLAALAEMKQVLDAAGTWHKDRTFVPVAASGVRPSVHGPAVTTHEWRPE